jgi:hypothetical protein
MHQSGCKQSHEPTHTQHTLDEPTSGLDSFAALSVMTHLQGMARGSGRIIISTIHQPRSAIWEMFDRVGSDGTQECMQVCCQHSRMCCGAIVLLQPVVTTVVNQVDCTTCCCSQ